MDSDSVSSRFITQGEVEAAKERREEQWKAAYARLGQEPPPQQQEEVFDGRSLAEKLHANKIAKQEEWEEKTKLANQFRALEEDEIMFLDSLRQKQMEEERIRKEQDGEELKGFRQAVAARINAASVPAPAPAVSQAPASKPAKKDAKPSLKGIVVKKKGKPAQAASKVAKKEGPVEEKQKQDKDNDDEPNPKRRKVEESKS